MQPLEDLKIVSLAVNLPGPVTARGLLRLGAEVVKIEPPAGDPLQHFFAAWYRDLNAGQEVLKLDLKSEPDRAQLDQLLQNADLLLTATRPAALATLGLDRDSLQQKFPRLCQVAIVGYSRPRENEPGHDLTYQAEMGLLNPPQMPRTLLADMAGAEHAISAALALLLGRERGRGNGYTEVSLGETARGLAEPIDYGATASGALLGGGLTGYNLYQSSDGWIALAALEPHFRQRLEKELNCALSSKAQLQTIFAGKTANEWQAWGIQLDLPIVAVKTDSNPVTARQTRG